MTVSARIFRYLGYGGGQYRGHIRREGEFPEARPRALTAGELSALSDLDNISVRIADVAAYLARLGYRLGDELGPRLFHNA